MFDAKRLRPLIRRKSRITEAAGLYRSVFCPHLVIARLADENFNAVEKNYSDESAPRACLHQSVTDRAVTDRAVTDRVTLVTARGADPQTGLKVGEAMTPSSQEITQWLVAWSNGDSAEIGRAHV